MPRRRRVSCATLQSSAGSCGEVANGAARVGGRAPRRRRLGPARPEGKPGVRPPSRPCRPAPPSPPISTGGSPMPSVRSSPSSRTRARRPSHPRSHALKPSRRPRTSSSCSTRTPPQCRPRGRARRRRDDAPRARALPRHGHSGDRRQLRPRRVPDGDHGRRSRGRHSRACSRATTAPSSLATLEVTWAAPSRSPSTTSSSRAATLGRMVELGHCDRRRGAGRAAVRRPDLRDARRVDRVQPLERRAGARLGPRRDGADVRRAARARRAGRSSSRAAPTRSITNLTKGLDAIVLVDGHEVGTPRPRRAGRCPRRPRAEPARDAARSSRSSAGTPPPSGTESAGRRLPYHDGRAADAADREPRADPRGGARARRAAERRSPARPARGRRSSRTRSACCSARSGDAALIGAAGEEAYVEAEFERRGRRGARAARRAAS